MCNPSLFRRGSVFFSCPFILAVSQLRCKAIGFCYRRYRLPGKRLALKKIDERWENEIENYGSQFIEKLQTQRSSAMLTHWLVSRYPGCQDIFDVGCDDGIVKTRLPAGCAYRGIDIGADIYSRAPDKGIQYIENAEAIESELRDYQPAQMVFLFDVLEHTASFVNLFEIALDLATERVFVSLPNETNLRVAMGIF